MFDAFYSFKISDPSIIYTEQEKFQKGRGRRHTWDFKAQDLFMLHVFLCYYFGAICFDLHMLVIQSCLYVKGFEYFATVAVHKRFVHKLRYSFWSYLTLIHLHADLSIRLHLLTFSWKLEVQMWKYLRTDCCINSLRPSHEITRDGL
jgi:hypothetical protein